MRFRERVEHFLHVKASKNFESKEAGGEGEGKEEEEVEVDWSHFKARPEENLEGVEKDGVAA